MKATLLLFSMLMMASACRADSATSATSELPASELLAPDFWTLWGDGQAELNGYRLTQPRYGQLRPGRAVLIFVTETFSQRERVKSDPGRNPPGDEFPVMKLNVMKEFQTGIYDYNVMTSAFAQLSSRGGQSAGDLTKLTFSSQEWCGHVFQELLFDSKRIRDVRHSYFGGEGTESIELLWKAGGISADALPLRIRGFTAPLLQPGERRMVPFLPSLTHTRLLHRPLEWTTATLRRSQTSARIAVPAGEIEADQWDVEVKNGISTTYFVESASPHRILAWESSDGEKGELLKSTRLKYWELNKPGDEKWLEAIGLPIPGDPLKP